MIVILILLPLSLLVAGGFLTAFFWAVRSGQFEDTCTPAMRVLADDAAIANKTPTSTISNDQPSH